MAAVGAAALLVGCGGESEGAKARPTTTTTPSATTTAAGSHPSADGTATSRMATREDLTAGAKAGGFGRPRFSELGEDPFSACGMHALLPTPTAPDCTACSLSA
ncbi:hypothetical protein SSP24_24700 [Streptomyces spinoverrucosus]|uniref:Uncharacterized protein n=1 Tax=Streptomyces spinoverrucosus TaxID=284043 RepID=A0A4Y3VF02_9ACTN|nr:hypothetical protein SSP24_24700 [Streptomyces spinoverrucosus]GHB59864.1 hypothetical protein GCM10010397_32540 [Streptomyces spinoverrucosus]